MERQTQSAAPLDASDPESAFGYDGSSLEPNAALAKVVLRTLMDMMAGFDPATQDVRGVTSRILTAGRRPCDFPAPSKTIH